MKSKEHERRERIKNMKNENGIIEKNKNDENDKNKKNKKKILMEKKLKEKYDLKNKENVKRINQRLKYGEIRKNLYQDKNAAKDKKYNEYVKKYNRENENKIAGTHGGWKEEKRWCITKTNWQWKQEEKAANEEEKPEKPQITKETKAIIIYDGKEAGVYRAELEKYKYSDHSKIIIAKIRSGQRKVKLQLQEYKFGKENKNVEIEEMKMNEEDIISCAIENGTEVYSISKIYD